MSAPTNKSAIVGIDGGGSSTKAIAVDGSGKMVGRGMSGPSNPNNSSYAAAATEILNAIAQASGEHAINSVCLGVAGIATQDQREELRNELLELRPELSSSKIKITHDLKIAQHAAFNGKAGAVVIAGTGSACYVKLNDGSEKRISGRSFQYDDPGSGYAIGKRAIEMKLFPKEISRSVISALAVEVVRAAKTGNEAAIEILKKEANNLAELAKPIATGTPTVLVGGMLESESVYLEMVREALAFLKIVKGTQQPPVIGALLMAWGISNGNPTPALNLRI